MTRIAAAWDVSVPLVAKVRDGLLPLTDSRIRALPEAQRVHLFEVMNAQAQTSFKL